MQIIDFHTHPGTTGLEQFGYTFTPELFVSELKRAGITKACGSTLNLELLAASMHDFGAIEQLNRIAWHHHELYPDFFVPGIHIHPAHVEQSIGEIENYAQKGVRLVGELVPYLMGYDSSFTTYTLPGYAELFDVCNQHNMVLSLHRPLDDNECDMLAGRYRNLSVVIAHPLCGDTYLSLLKVVKKHDNLFIDLAGTGIAAYGMLRYGIDAVGAEKILFGTDFPINAGMYVAAVMYEKLTDAEREAVLHKNAERILFGA